MYPLGLSSVAIGPTDRAGGELGPSVLYPLSSEAASLPLASCLGLHIPGDGELTLSQRSHFHCGIVSALEKSPTELHHEVSYTRIMPRAFSDGLTCGLDLGQTDGIPVCSVPCKGREGSYGRTVEEALLLGKLPCCPLSA